MRADNARSGFPFQPTEFWQRETGVFERLFQITGINAVEDEYFNTRFSGTQPHDERLYEWFLCVFYRLLKSTDKLGILERMEATLAWRSPEIVMGKNKVKVGLPILVDGRKVSADLLFTTYDIYQLVELVPGLLEKPYMVADLGAGWGRIGYMLLSLNPSLTYALFDIPDSLLVSSEYLPRLLPDCPTMGYLDSRQCGTLDRQTLGARRLWFLGTHDLPRVAARTFDLVINVQSFQEMRPDQVNRYLEMFAHCASGGHLYHRNNTFGRECRAEDYRYPQTWQRIFERPASYSDKVVDAGWRLP